MTNVVVAVIAAIAGIVPALVLLGSAPRRRLRLMREEAETIDSLPVDHPAREILNKSLTYSAKRYRRYWRSAATRPLLYMALLLTFWGSLAKAGSSIVRSDQKDESPAQQASRVSDQLDSQGTWYIVAGYTILVLWMVLLFLDGWRDRQERHSSASPEEPREVDGTSV
jgi:hypothetical protein